MKLYLNELAPWERKKEYFHHILLGKDVREQTNILRDAINNQAIAQLASASSIVSSQERISEGISGLAQVTSEGFERVSDGIASLQASFEWGISEVVWQIEQNRDVLKDILAVLQAPLDTQAKERRRRAEEAFANGWIEDAEEEFLESEKLNKYDFSIHISLGMIYLFHKIDKEKALECFEKAAKYAKPKSAYHSSFALLYKSLIKRDFDLIGEAKKCTEEAIDLTPNFAEVLYQDAIYNSLLGHADLALKRLKKLISIDPLYCIKVQKQQEFSNITDKINDLFIQFNNDLKNEAKSIFSFLKTMLDKVEKLSKDMNQISMMRTSFEITNDNISRIESLLKRDSIFDHFESIKQLQEYKKSIESQLRNALHKFPDEYSRILNFKRSKDNEREMAKKKLDDSMGMDPLIHFCLLFFILGFIFKINGWLLTGTFWAFPKSFYISWIILTIISVIIMRSLKKRWAYSKITNTQNLDEKEASIKNIETELQDLLERMKVRSN